MLRRVRFGKSGEQLSGVQGSLLEETVQTDLSAIEAELELLHGVPLHEPKSANNPVRTRLPEHLPRVTIIHEPDSTVCQCGCQLQRIGEDVAEKLDYVPAGKNL